LHGEERVYADPLLVARLRERLDEYLSGVLRPPRLDSNVGFLVGEKGCVGDEGLEPGRVVVVDGGSNILPLNAGYVGIVASLGILVEGNRVVGRIMEEPEFVPSSPSELGLYESVEQVKGVVDKLREAKVFETAFKLLGEEPELLIVDGPLMPHGVLARRTSAPEAEARALKRYREAVLSLHRGAMGSDVSLVGFVKRPRSRLLTGGMRGEAVFDHILLLSILREAEYAPRPP